MIRRTSVVLALAAVFAAQSVSANARPMTELTGQVYDSGIDAAHYSGPIPARGQIIAQAYLDPHVRIPNAGKQFRILYSTVDGNGRPAVSSGAVYLPDTPPPPGGYPLLAYAHGTTGIGDGCAPSTVEDLDPLIEDRSKWLRQGYALVASDYVGLGTPGLHDFLATQAAATSVTDAVIAAKRADFPVTDKWAVYGHSQGGQVALATARYATELTRAAGLDFRGAVSTAPPANIETVLPAFGPDSPPFPLPSGLATFPLYLLNGVANAHPDVNIESVLTPLGKEWLANARELCVDKLGKALGDIDLRDFFTAPISSIPNIDAILRDYMQVPFSGYDRPIFLGHGAVDTLAPIVTSLSQAAQMAAAGQPVEYHVYPTADHTTLGEQDHADVTAFLHRIMS